MTPKMEFLVATIPITVVAYGLGYLRGRIVEARRDPIIFEVEDTGEVRR